MCVRGRGVAVLVPSREVVGSIARVRRLPLRLPLRTPYRHVSEFSGTLGKSITEMINSG